MRDVRFKYHRGSGHGSWEYATLRDFLHKLPAFFHVLYVGLVPPLHVVNQVLRTGTDAEGMGGIYEWKPFQLDAREYDELVTELLAAPEGKYIRDEALDSAPNLAKWIGAVMSAHRERWRRDG